MMTNDKKQLELEAFRVELSEKILRSGKRVKYEKDNRKNSSDHCTIDSLPIEVLTKICQYLPHADRFPLERVCRKWRSAARDSWRDVRLILIEPVDEKPNTFPKRKTIFTVGDEVTIKTDRPVIIRSVLSRCGKYIRTFAYGCHHEKFQLVAAIVNEYCRNIESLNLWVTVEIDDGELPKLFEMNNKLNCFECEASDFAEDLINVLPLRDWKILKFSVEEEFEDCREKLVELISNSHSLKKFGIDRWSSDLIEAISKHESLELLHFNEWTCSIEEAEANYKLKETHKYTIDFPESLSQHCRNLKELYLEGAEFTMKTFEAISSFQHLESLHLDYLRITDRVLIRLTNFKILQLAVPTGYTEDGLLEMIKNSESLEELDISEGFMEPRIFTQLVNEIGRTKLKKIAVNFLIREEVTEIFKGTSIKIVDDMDFESRF